MKELALLLTTPFFLYLSQCLLLFILFTNPVYRFTLPSPHHSSLFFHNQIIYLFIILFICNLLSHKNTNLAQFIKEKQWEEENCDYFFCPYSPTII